MHCNQRVILFHGAQSSDSRVQGSCRNVPPLRQAPGRGLTTLQPTQVSVGHRSGRYLLTNPAPVRTCSVVIDRNNNNILVARFLTPQIDVSDCTVCIGYSMVYS